MTAIQSLPPRLLTPGEIIQLKDEYENQHRWEQAHKLAQTLYGPQARWLTLSMTANDRQGTFADHIDIVVLDHAGGSLSMDTRLPWWQQFDPLAAGADWKDQPPIQQALLDLVAEAFDVEFLDMRWEPVPPITFCFDFAVPPPISFPHVGAASTATTMLAPGELRQLGQEYEYLQRWTNVHQFVKTLYGESAHQVELALTLEYNDEGYNEELNLKVLDSQGIWLRFDFSLPWWQQFQVAEESIGEYLQYHDRDLYQGYDNINSAAYFDSVLHGPYDYRRDSPLYVALHRLAFDLLGIEFQERETDEEGLVETYLLAAPPPISHPKVYVVEEYSA